MNTQADTISRTQKINKDLKAKSERDEHEKQRLVDENERLKLENQSREEHLEEQKELYRKGRRELVKKCMGQQGKMWV